MKVYRLLIIAVFFTASASFVMTGCKYDVAEPGWDKPYVEPSESPKINSITPSNITPGVNTILVTGERFDLVPDSLIYFDVVGKNVQPAEVIQKTTTTLLLRRPNIVAEACIVKLVPDSGQVVKSAAFRIEAVFSEFSTFLENAELKSAVMDDANNLYISQANNIIWKINPSGDKTLVDTAGSTPFTMRIGPGGYLYLLEGDRVIERVNLQNNTISNWHRLKDNKKLRTGDFDSEGKFLYAGGIRTDLYWINTQDSTSGASGNYSAASSDRDSLLAVRYNNGYVYVILASLNGRFIYKHAVNGNTVGPKELVSDLSNFPSKKVVDLSFSSDGKMFIVTDDLNPMLIFDPANNSVDYFYKGILPHYGKSFCWGNDTNIYLICGDNVLSAAWKLYKVDVGVTGL